ncbi:hypothetical protein [Halorussus limi]|nr:hypothetical protein [Halorussus limi]
MSSQLSGATVARQETKTDDSRMPESEDEQDAEKTLDDIIDAYTS